MVDRSYQVSYPQRGSVLGESEIAAVARLVHSGNSLSQGWQRLEFEERFGRHVGTPHALSVTSGTVALEIAIRLLGLRRGDEVIVTPQTYKATIQPLLNYDVTVRFCDVDPRSLNATAETIEPLLTSRTRAVLLVHYGGVPCDMDGITALTRPRGITVVEDCAHAIGSVYKGRRPGALADIGCFSFHSSKNISTLGEGGMITLTEPGLAERVERLRSNEADAVYEESLQPIGGWTGAQPWMMHPGPSFTHRCTAVRYGGTNATLSEAGAVVGSAQLDRLPALMARRRLIASRIDEVLARFPGVSVQAVPPDATHSYHLYTFFVEPESGIDRDRLIDRLDALGVQMQLRYFPLHLLAEWRARGHGLGECPVAEHSWFHRQVNLPCHPGLTDAQVDRMTDLLEAALAGERGKSGATAAGRTVAVESAGVSL
ncbi:DegT/DnrJ/EryC1/StrS family aminotransferase [Amycolatopsis azurea]|uniref:DegT/DnrJ/EryC1/StrS aminotransferase family protein n=1 Tax=Amycolatopsis azurea TaxID=36819 RepID=UPI0038111D80